MVDLKWLDSTGWLKEGKATVQIPQDVLRQLVEEIREYREGTTGQLLSEESQAVYDRIGKLTHSKSADLRWLSGYTLQLLRACLLVLGHLDRIAPKNFVPRAVLERAMRGEE